MILADAPFADEAELALLRGVSSAASAMVLEQASAQIRTYCGWHIWPSRAEVVTVDGSWARTLTLPTLHLTALTALTADGVEVLSTDYSWTEHGTVIHLSGWWPGSSRGVVASIVHGFPDPLPDLAALCIDLAARRLASPSGAVRTQVGQISRQYGSTGGSLAQHEEWLLDRYKIPERA